MSEHCDHQTIAALTGLPDWPASASDLSLLDECETGRDQSLGGHKVVEPFQRIGNEIKVIGDLGQSVEI